MCQIISLSQKSLLPFCIKAPNILLQILCSASLLTQVSSKYVSESSNYLYPDYSFYSAANIDSDLILNTPNNLQANTPQQIISSEEPESLKTITPVPIPRRKQINNFDFSKLNSEIFKTNHSNQNSNHHYSSQSVPKFNRYVINHNQTFIFIGGKNYIYKLQLNNLSKIIQQKQIGPVYQNKCFTLTEIEDPNTGLKERVSLFNYDLYLNQAGSNHLFVENFNAATFKQEDLLNLNNSCSDLNPQNYIDNQNHVLELLPDHNLLICNTAFNGICEIWDQHLNYVSGYNQHYQTIKSSISNSRSLRFNADNMITNDNSNNMLNLNQYLPSYESSFISNLDNPETYKTIILLTNMNYKQYFENGGSKVRLNRNNYLMFTARSIFHNGTNLGNEPTISARRHDCAGLTYNLSEGACNSTKWSADANCNDDCYHCISGLKQQNNYQLQSHIEYTYIDMFEFNTNEKFISVKSVKEHADEFLNGNQPSIPDVYHNFCQNNPASVFSTDKDQTSEDFFDALKSEMDKYVTSDGTNQQIFDSNLLDRDIGFIYLIANKIDPVSKKNIPVIIRIAKSNIHLETYSELPLKCADESYNYVTASKFKKSTNKFYISFAKKAAGSTSIIEESALCEYSIEQVTFMFNNILNDCRCSDKDFNQFRPKNKDNYQAYNADTASWILYKLTYDNAGQGYKSSIQYNTCGKERKEGWRPLNFLTGGMTDNCVSRECKKGVYLKCPKYDPGYYSNMNIGNTNNAEYPFILSESKLINYSENEFTDTTLIKQDIDGIITAIDIDYLDEFDFELGEEKSVPQIIVVFKSKLNAVTKIRKLRPPYTPLNSDIKLKGYQWVEHTEYSTQIQSADIPNMEIFQDKLLYIVNQGSEGAQLVKSSLANCEAYKTCNDCYQDNYCGWCVLTSKCTIQKKCEIESSKVLKQTIWSQESCENLELRHKQRPAIPKFLVQNNYTSKWEAGIVKDLKNLYKKNQGVASFTCKFYSQDPITGKSRLFKQSKAMVTLGGKIDCDFILDEIEIKAKYTDKKYKVELYFLKYKILDTILHVYDCSVHRFGERPCNDCTTYSIHDDIKLCKYLPVSSACRSIIDSDQIPSKGEDVYNKQNMITETFKYNDKIEVLTIINKDFCPRVLSRTEAAPIVHNGAETKIQQVELMLPTDLYLHLKGSGRDNFECHVKDLNLSWPAKFPTVVDGAPYRNTTLKGFCLPQRFNMKAEHADLQSQDYSVNLAIQTTTKFDTAATPLKIKTYNCESKSKPNDCSTCVNSHLTQNYACVWCDGICKYSYGLSDATCPNQYVKDHKGGNANHKCPPPESDQMTVFPNNGPEEGNTLISIKAKNIAVIPSQINNIYIGNSACADWKFINPSEITCVTPKFRPDRHRNKQFTSNSLDMNIAIDSKSYGEKYFENKFTYKRIKINEKSIFPKHVIQDGKAKLTLQGYGVGSGRKQKFQISSPYQSDEGAKLECLDNDDNTCEVKRYTDQLDIYLPKFYNYAEDNEIKLKSLKECELEIDDFKDDIKNCFTVHNNPEIVGFTEPATCQKDTDCVKSYVAGGGTVQFILEKKFAESYTGSRNISMWSSVKIYLKFDGEVKSQETTCEPALLQHSYYHEYLTRKSEDNNSNNNNNNNKNSKINYETYTVYNCTIPSQPLSEIIKSDSTYYTGQGKIYLKIDNYHKETDKIISFMQNPNLIETSPKFNEKRCSDNLKDVESSSCKLNIESIMKVIYTDSRQNCAICQEVAGWDQKVFKLVQKYNQKDEIVEYKMASAYKPEDIEGITKQPDDLTLNVAFSIKKEDLKYGKYDLELHVGNYKAVLPNNVLIEKPASNIAMISTIIISILMSIFLIAIIVYLIFRNKKLNKNANEDFKKQIDRIKEATEAEFKRQFTDLITDERLDLETYASDITDIPYFNFGNYYQNVLYPRDQNNLSIPILTSEDASIYHDGFLNDLLSLLLNPTFCHALIAELENSHEIYGLDYLEIASLLSIVLCTRPDHFTNIFEKILSNLASNYATPDKTHKFLFRLDKIQDRIIMNYIYWCMWPTITDSDVGKKIYILINAIRKLQSHAPVDFVKNQAAHTLAEKVMLKQKVEFNKIEAICQVDDNIDLSCLKNKINESRSFNITLLDCDTVIQAKDKILYQIYQNTAYTNWVKNDQIILENRKDKQILVDKNHEDGRIWTLKDYGIRNRSNFSLLIRKKEDLLSTNLSKLRKSSSSMGEKGSTDWSHDSDIAAVYETTNFLPQNTPQSEKSKSGKKVKKLGGSKNTIDFFNNTSTSYEALNNKTPIWHLVNPATDYDNLANVASQKSSKFGRFSSKNSSQKTRLLADPANDNNTGMSEEFFNLKLVTSRRCLDTSMKPALESTIPTDVKSVPTQMKYLFDLIDIHIQENGLKDKTTNHEWKSNCMIRKYWAQGIINKPENIFDIPQDLLANATLELVAKTLSDACEWENVQTPTHYEDAATLTTYQQTKELQSKIRQHYRTCSEKTPVKREDVIEIMNKVITQSKTGMSIQNHFNLKAALIRLWKKYIQPNYDRITSNDILADDGDQLIEELRTLYEDDPLSGYLGNGDENYTAFY